MKKFLVVLMLIFLCGCSLKDSWTAFYYPNLDNLSVYEMSPDLDSLEECRDWIDDIASYNINYDYECGKNCKYKKDYGMYVCEVTEK